MSTRSGNGRNTGPSDVKGEIAKVVQAELDSKIFPGAVVVLGTPEGVLYHEAFGFSQVTPEATPMERASIFDVASITKVVCTATAVGICMDLGLICLGASLMKYLPDHQGKGVDGIHLRSLGSHVSGFSDPMNTEIYGDEMFSQMLKNDPTYPIDSCYTYSCYNSILLGIVVERVTGRPFGEFCRDNIFQPLRMTESSFNRIEPSSRVVSTHHLILGENHNSFGRWAGRAVGNAGLFTTASDLTHFAEMMLNDGTWCGQRILSPGTIADLTAPYHLSKFPRHAFLWEIDQGSSHRPALMSAAAYGHGGSTGISLWIDPHQKVYTLVMTNRTHPRLDEFPSGKEPASSPRVSEQCRARGRIADAVLGLHGAVDHVGI